MLSDGCLRILTLSVAVLFVSGFHHAMPNMDSYIGFAKPNVGSGLQIQMARYKVPLLGMSSSFDVELAVALGGYSFEVYNEPGIGKIAAGLDGTTISFHDTSFIRTATSGVILGTLQSATFDKSKVKEEQLMERLLTGSDPDPFFTIHSIDSSHSSGSSSSSTSSVVKSELSGLSARVMDSFTSTHRPNTLSPQYRENFQLYIRSTHEQDKEDRQKTRYKELKSQTLLLRAFDKDVIHLGGWDSGSAWEEEGIAEGQFDLSHLELLPPVTRAERATQSSESVESLELLELHEGGGTVTVPLYATATNLQQQRGDRQVETGVMARVKVGEVKVDLLFVPWGSNRSNSRNTTGFSGANADSDITNTTTATTEMKEMKEKKEKSKSQSLIRGATEGVGWGDLLSRLKGVRGLEGEYMSSVGSGSHITDTGRMKHICSIENANTDTQCRVWADLEDRTCVISFRGTEQIKIRDVLTDVNLLQVQYNTTSPERSPFDGSVISVEGKDNYNYNDKYKYKDSSRLEYEGSNVLVHCGFYSAFRSVQPALLQILGDLLGGGNNVNVNDNNIKMNKPWNILITGHSLGGALASLLSFELARLQKEVTLDSEFKATETGTREGEGEGEGNGEENRVRDALKSASVTCYTFGAPRVGNRAFSKMSGTLLPRHFRLVNDQDIVPSVPRSSSLMSVPTSLTSLSSLSSVNLDAISSGVRRGLLGQAIFGEISTSSTASTTSIASTAIANANTNANDSDSDNNNSNSNSNSNSYTAPEFLLNTINTTPEGKSDMLEFEHTGRCVVMVAPATVSTSTGKSGSGSGKGSSCLWVEGESTHPAPIALQDFSPFYSSNGNKGAGTGSGQVAGYASASRSEEEEEEEDKEEDKSDNEERDGEGSLTLQSLVRGAAQLYGGYNSITSTATSDSSGSSDSSSSSGTSGISNGNYESLLALAAQLDESWGSFSLDLPDLSLSLSPLKQLENIGNIANFSGFEYDDRGRDKEKEAASTDDPIYTSTVSAVSVVSASVSDRLQGFSSALDSLNRDLERSVRVKSGEISMMEMGRPILDPDFLERELGMLQALVDKRAIEHHLEPSYFNALLAVLGEYHELVEGQGEEEVGSA